MVFNIKLQLLTKPAELPFNYQYLVSSWIYKTIQQADEEFADFLHNKGINLGNKQYRFFNFSPLDLYPYKKTKNGFSLQGDSISLKVAFHLDKSAENFIKGLFLAQKGFFNHLQFEVSHIESIPHDEFAQTITYQTESPITLSFQAEDKPKPQYVRLDKDEEHFKQLFINNLIHRYTAYQDSNGETCSPEFANEPISLTILENGGSKLIDIKGSKIKAYHSKFELTAPKEIHQILAYSGAGEKGSQGFGFCKAI